MKKMMLVLAGGGVRLGWNGFFCLSSTLYGWAVWWLVGDCLFFVTAMRF